MAYTPSADLLFGTPPATDGNLVFGTEDTSTVALALAITLPGPTLAARVSPVTSATLTVALPAPTLTAEVLPSVEATAALTLPGPTLVVTVLPSVSATLTAVLPGPTLAADAIYTSYTERPTVGALASDWQYAEALPAGTEDRREATRKDVSGQASIWQSAVPAEAGAQSFIPANLIALPANRSAGHAEAARLSPAGWGVTADNALHDRRARIASRQQDAAPTRLLRALPYQDALRGARRHIAENWQAAIPRSRAVYRHGRGNALPRCEGWAQWAQNAGTPRPGVYMPPTPPVTPPDLGCYDRQPHLLFKDAVDGTGSLLFICDNWRGPEEPAGLVVVPVRKVYMQLNTQSLVLADSGVSIPAHSLRLSIDADSWVWGWSASVPASYLGVLSAPIGNLVELIATLNGTPFRLAVERVSRDRQFGLATLAISGRGRAAWLDDPYAAIVSRGNTEDRTAQQLMADALTENGVSIGWSVDWQITDWLVPAGAWNHTGSAMNACLAIAEAAGAYIQAHRTEQVLTVLSRYPAAPWNWAGLMPDIQLPEDVCITEGIEWVDKPQYNTVFVSGQSGGILAHVTRQGTAGDKAAPMVTDALITHGDAGRQRGTRILSDTGRQKLITLSLPVLAETGIIVPGKMIRYSENGTQHLGLTRSVDVTAEFPKVRQTIQVESHAL